MLIRKVDKLGRISSGGKPGQIYQIITEGEGLSPGDILLRPVRVVAEPINKPKGAKKTDA